VQSACFIALFETIYWPFNKTISGKLALSDRLL